MSSSTRFAFATAAALALLSSAATAQYSASYVASPSGLPLTTEGPQTGTNRCGTASSATSECQNIYLNSITDFCLFAPPVPGTVSDHEGDAVSYCTKSGRGTRLIPDGTITGASFVYAPHYVQVTGHGDFTKINVTPGDAGGELDPHGADGTGNPKGGLVFHCSNGKCNQMHEWMEFLSSDLFCIRGCYDSDRATSLCRHTYDELGCNFNMPANYPEGYFETCDSDDAEDIAFYGSSYFAQDMTKTGAQVPAPHAPPHSSMCSNVGGNQLYGDAGPNAFGGSSANTNVATASISNSSTSSSSSSSSSSTTPTTTSSSTSSTTNTSSSSSSMTTPRPSSSDGGNRVANTPAGTTTTQSNGPHSFVSAATAAHVGVAACVGFAGLMAGVLFL